MKLYELGEFGLIELIRQIVDQAAVAAPGLRQNLVIGIGDDAACWRSEAGLELATTDTLVQDVHFSLETATWGELGGKALAVNLSDIAAMGGTPRYALLTLALPRHTQVEEVDAFCHGLVDLAQEFGVALVGGDLVDSTRVVITVALFGLLEPGLSPLSRTAARPGDQIAVTGYLGGAAGWLAMLQKKLSLDAQTRDYLRQAHWRPQPRVAEGQILARLGVKAAIDISDGLLADLAHICLDSGVAARIDVDSLPIHPRLRAAFGRDSLDLALSGGEDYELIFTAPPGLMSQVEQAMSCPVTVAGQIIEGKAGEVSLTDKKGRPFPWQKGGWQHFRPESL